MSYIIVFKGGNVKWSCLFYIGHESQAFEHRDYYISFVFLEKASFL